MDQVGSYRILEQIGAGGMGVVYRGLDQVIQRSVAIKTIRMDDRGDPAQAAMLRERLLREAQAAGNLSHPNIVTIYHVGQQSGWAYIAMEFVNGPTLEKVLASGGLKDPRLAMSILRETASALDYAHRKGIVHRDIKPANVMLHESGSVKLTDFGLARWASTSTLTQTGMAVGTPHYMSPEQIQGQPVDGRSDQFALGVIAYEILTGQRPFEGDTLSTLVYKIVYEQPQAPHLLNRTVPPRVEPIIRRALAKKTEDRFPTCSEFIEALSRAVEGARDWCPGPTGAPNPRSVVPTPAPPPAPGPQSTTQPVSGGKYIVAGVMSAVLVLGALTGLYFLNRPKPQPQPPAQTVSNPAGESSPVAAPKPPAGPRVPDTPPRVEPPAKEAAPMPGIRRIEVEPEVQMKKAVFHPKPKYPDLARVARVQGEVFLSVVIGADGRVRSLEALHGHPLLIPAAIETVKNWRWRPSVENGVPVEVETRVVVNFSLAYQ